MLIVATTDGCRLFDDEGEQAVELAGRFVVALAPDASRGCVAVVDEREVWRRDARGAWQRVARCEIGLESVVCVGNTILGGSNDDASLVRIDPNTGTVQSLSFGEIEGRSTWYAGGPPLGVRSLAATCDGGTLLAGVHVGGIPRSTDGGKTWTPTIPVDYDVHEVRTHRSIPFVAAATAAGLCVSRDAGCTWERLDAGLVDTHLLAVAVCDDEVLFSAQDGPFPPRSQIWRWPLAGGRLERVRDGLPEWLTGKVDTAKLVTHENRAALVDGGGNLWLSTNGSRNWKPLAEGVTNVYAMSMI